MTRSQAWAMACVVAVLTGAGAASAAPRITLLDHHQAWPARPPVTVLITAAGTSVGNPWQAWLQGSDVPTPPGRVTLTLTRCPGWDGYAAACSSADQIWLDTTSLRGQIHPLWLRRATLLHETGHVFDDRVLTDRDRLAFMRLWGAKIRAGESVAQNWDHGEAAMDGMMFGEYPPAEWFAEGYRLCASYRRWTSEAAENEQNDIDYANNGRFTGIDYDYPAGWSARYDAEDRPTPIRLRRWSLREQRATCRLIAQAARD